MVIDLAHEYPIQLSLAYLFLVGYLFRTAFLSCYLPGAVGVIVSGFLFSYFIQADVLAGRDTLQGLAFFLVLLTAGFEISIFDLRPYILVYSLLPSTMELMGIAYYAVHFMGYTWVEGLVLGTALFCVGDGLVIPRMMELTRQFPGHPMPRFVFMCAPLEASYALTLFGVLAGLSEPAKNPDVQILPLVIANVVRIIATLLFGAFLGIIAGNLISTRMQVMIPGTNRPVFTGAAVEAYLMILAVALAGFGLGMEYHGHVVIPMGFSPGSLFQPELLVIVIGAFFAHVADPDMRAELETIVAGVWVFGQLVLFSMLGSKTDTSVFSYIPQVLPLMGIGLALRFLGMCIATFITLPIRPCNCKECYQANWESKWPDAVFCFLSMLPRATIQGALGPVAAIHQFFSNSKNGGDVDKFIGTAARLYIVCMAIGGSILLDLYGPRMLKAASTRTARCHASQMQEELAAEECWERQRSWSSVGGEMDIAYRSGMSSRRKESELSNNNYSSLSAMNFGNWDIDDCPEVQAAIGTLTEALGANQNEVMKALKKVQKRHATGTQTPPPIKPERPNSWGASPGDDLPFSSMLGVPSAQKDHRGRAVSDLQSQPRATRTISGNPRSQRVGKRRSISEDVGAEGGRGRGQPGRLERAISAGGERAFRHRTVSEESNWQPFGRLKMGGSPYGSIRKGSGFAGVAMFEARPAEVHFEVDEAEESDSTGGDDAPADPHNHGMSILITPADQQPVQADTMLQDTLHEVDETLQDHDQDASETLQHADVSDGAGLDLDAAI